MKTFIFKALFQAIVTGTALLSVVATDDYEAIEGGQFTEPPTRGGWVDYSDALLPRIPHAAPAPVEATFSGDDKEFLKCARMVSGNCGEEIFEYIFSGGDDPGLNCCKELVSMGKSCHDILTYNVITKVPALGDEIEKDRKDEKVWSYCLEKKASEDVLKQFKTVE